MRANRAVFIIATDPKDDSSVMGKPKPSMYAVRSLTYVTRWSSVHPRELNSHLRRISRLDTSHGGQRGLAQSSSSC